MANAKKVGYCCICGKYGPLSKEHIPPQEAFNKTRTEEHPVADYFNASKPRGKTRQGGVAYYSICPQCNNDTGAWYGSEYKKWAEVGFDALVEMQKNERSEDLVTFYQSYPLRFLKQVVACFLSVNGQHTNGNYIRLNPDLAAFVLDKTKLGLSSRYKFYLILYPYGTIRHYLPLASKISMIYNEKRQIISAQTHIFSELAHPPFGLVMTDHETQPFPDATDITFLRDFQYDEIIDLKLPLKVALPVRPSSVYPGDY